MAYIKLPSRLQRALEEARQTMRQMGYQTADLRWLEQHHGECPLCGEKNVEPGTLSTVGLPEAGMVHVPYTICKRCVETKYNVAHDSFGDENLAKIETTIKRTLGYPESTELFNHIPPKMADEVRALMDVLAKEKIGVNLRWILERATECPSCGSTTTAPSRAGVGVFAGPNLRPVGIPYLICQDCTDFSDEELSARTRPRLETILNP